MTNEEIDKVFPLKEICYYIQLRIKFKKYSYLWHKYAPKKNIGDCMSNCKEYNPKTYNDFYHYYLQNVKNISEILEIAKNFLNDIPDKSFTTLEECVDILIYHSVIETYRGWVREKKIEEFLKSKGGEILKNNGEDDSKRGIDILLTHRGNLVIIQVKPSSFIYSIKSDCIKDRIEAYKKMYEALQKYPNAKYFFCIYNSNDEKWYAKNDSNIFFNIDELFTDKGYRIFDTKNYKTIDI